MSNNVNGHSSEGNSDDGKRYVTLTVEDIDFVGEISGSGKTNKVAYIVHYVKNSDGKTVTIQLNAWVRPPYED